MLSIDTNFEVVMFIFLFLQVGQRAGESLRQDPGHPQPAAEHPATCTQGRGPPPTPVLCHPGITVFTVLLQNVASRKVNVT